MSSMLEQAIIDAEQLKETAQKTAEESIVEKYQDEIKDAVSKILEQDDPMGDAGETLEEEDVAFVNDLPAAQVTDTAEVVTIDLDKLEELMAEEDLDYNDMSIREEVAEEIDALTEDDVMEFTTDDLEGLAEGEVELDENMLYDIIAQALAEGMPGSGAGDHSNPEADEAAEEEAEKAAGQTGAVYKGVMEDKAYTAKKEKPGADKRKGAEKRGAEGTKKKTSGKGRGEKKGDDAYVNEKHDPDWGEGEHEYKRRTSHGVKHKAGDVGGHYKDYEQKWGGDKGDESETHPGHLDYEAGKRDEYMGPGFGGGYGHLADAPGTDKKDVKMSKKRFEEKHQGYDDEEDESLGMRTGKESGKKQSEKARREDSYGKWGKRDKEDRGTSLEEDKPYTAKKEKPGADKRKGAEKRGAEGTKKKTSGKGRGEKKGDDAYVNEGRIREQRELSTKVHLLEEKLEKYGTVVSKLKQKLDESNLTNAKLLYQNRILNSVSLNERQKNKIVEAISNAATVEAAKIIFETLQSAVGSAKKRNKPESLNEVVTRSSSTFLPRREEARKVDPFAERMKALAGLK